MVRFLVLILLCAGFSIVTLEEQWPTDAGAAKKVVAQAKQNSGTESNALILVRQGGEGSNFADALETELKSAGVEVLGKAVTQPLGARKTLVDIGASEAPLALILADRHMASFVLNSFPN